MQRTIWLPVFLDQLLAIGPRVRAMLSFICGALLSYTAAPNNLYPLFLVALPLLYLVHERAEILAGERRLRASFLVGWSAGFGYLVSGLNWIGESFQNQSNVPAELAPVAITALTALLALYYGLAFMLVSYTRARGLIRVLIFAASWVLFEMARGALFTGFPWLLIGTAWSDWLPLSQSIRWISVYGLSALTIIVSLAPVALLESRVWCDIQERNTDWRGMISFSILAPLVFGIVAVAGAYRLSQHNTEYETSVKLRLVQANIPQRDKWNPRLIDDHFAKHIRLSKGGFDPLAKARGIDLVIWPEATAPDWDFDRGQNLKRYLLSRTLDKGAVALVGGRRFEEDPATDNQQGEYRLYNSLLAVSAEGDILHRYDKTHLVPFGEYLPFQNILNTLGIEQLTGGRGFTEGARRDAISLPSIPLFAPLICYEVIFPGRVKTSPAGEQKLGWLLNITNDAWFGTSNGPHQHLAQARFRAIEEGLPVVRAAGTGISAIIDPYGRVISRLGIAREGVIDSYLPRPHSAVLAISTPWKTRIVLFVLLFIVIIALYGRKSKTN